MGSNRRTDPSSESGGRKGSRKQKRYFLHGGQEADRILSDGVNMLNRVDDRLSAASAAVWSLSLRRVRSEVNKRTTEQY